MGKGWIKLHRRAFDNPHLRKPNYFYVFMYLCSEANHDEDFDKEYIFKKVRIKLEKGQCIISQKELSKKSSIPLTTFNRILKKLKTEMMVETDSDNYCTLVTIKNYDKYQDVETKTETKRKPNGNQTETHKNYRTKELEKKEKPINQNFENFWSKYPNKKGKAKAQKSFEKIKQSEMDKFETAFNYYIESVKDRDQQYIKHGSAFFNQWRDIYTESQEVNQKQRVESQLDAYELVQMLD